MYIPKYFLLKQGNDTAWIDAHVSVLNNAVDTILRMSPGFVANNTEKVNSFRIETCLNNCSGNGVCAITGKYLYIPLLILRTLYFSLNSISCQQQKGDGAFLITVY
jgi:hypothetical protein